MGVGLKPRPMNTPHFPRLRSFTALLVLLVSSFTAHGEEPDLKFALDQLSANGSLPFTKKLFDHDLTLAQKAAVDLDRSIGRDLGILLDHEIIARTPITTRLNRFTIALHFENGPLFMSIDAYQSTQRQLYLRPRFSREITDLLPEEFIHGSRSN